MKVYKVFKDRTGKFEAVKEGWSWVAFFFTWCWALLKRQWWLGITQLGLTVLIMMFGAYIVGSFYGLRSAPPSDGELLGVYIFAIFVMMIPLLYLAAVFGKLGNKWLEKDLKRRHFFQVGTEKASTPDGAVANYIDQKQAQT